MFDKLLPRSTSWRFTLSGCMTLTAAWVWLPSAAWTLLEASLALRRNRFVVSGVVITTPDGRYFLPSSPSLVQRETHRLLLPARSGSAPDSSAFSFVDFVCFPCRTFSLSCFVVDDMIILPIALPMILRKTNYKSISSKDWCYCRKKEKKMYNHQVHKL